MKLKSALMCHAPIVIPQIAEERRSECEKSTRAMERAADFLNDSSLDLMIVISPHTPRFNHSYGITAGESIHGDFSAFGYPGIRMTLPGDPNAVNALTEVGAQHGIAISALKDFSLDHGATVPLYFLAQAGWNGKTLVMSFPIRGSGEGARCLGEAIRNYAKSSNGNIGILASGDMSHRILPDAPAGYHPRAKDFDSFVSKAIQSKDYKNSIQPDRSLRELAAEDVIDSLAVALNAGNFQSSGSEFYSYEAPFGVGYLVAALYEEEIAVQ